MKTLVHDHPLVNYVVLLITSMVWIPAWIRLDTSHITITMSVLRGFYQLVSSVSLTNYVDEKLVGPERQIVQWTFKELKCPSAASA